jgi:hypothetical protein
MLFCGLLGMHVILRPAFRSCYFAARFSNPIYFAAAFQTQFILRIAKIDNDPFFWNAPVQ